ncbi:MAG: GFA family protein [Deltaproteobacteria bacterium]|nr:GFA family protein [Deltaproteobacteria bacterium]MBW2416739.1 GFA family protein [Deltaproteobacteria bacterium]
MITGGCLCGRVRFEIDGRLTQIQICHAQRCQKATGSAFAPELAAKRSRFRWTAGEDLISRWEAPLLREPPPYRRAFCKVCGSPVPVDIEGTEFIGMLAGVLEGDLGTQAFRHIFVEQSADWHTIGDPLEQFPLRPPVGTRLRGPDR